MRTLFILLMLSACVWAQTAPEPTLEETTKWLQENLPVKAVYTSTGMETPMHARVTEAQFVGCRCQLTTNLTIGPPTFPIVSEYRYSFAAASLQANRIAVQEWTKFKPTGYYLKIYAVPNEMPIKTEDLRNGRVYKVSQGNEFSILIGSKEMAERFQKAFLRLITLCKSENKKEPF
ncbi:MAG: hypothetical protein HOP19_08510 [Acidobacteria bacterium]|nr:hypothetical protein [Acidobacteriota bacterium]